MARARRNGTSAAELSRTRVSDDVIEEKKTKCPYLSCPEAPLPSFRTPFVLFTLSVRCVVTAPHGSPMAFDLVPSKLRLGPGLERV